MDKSELRNPRLILFILAVFCLNVAALAILNSYDIRYGSVHLTAQAMFKPILMMNSCFILALMICGSAIQRHTATHQFSETRMLSSTVYRALLIALTIFLVAAVYLPSIRINFSHHDWTHRHISAGIVSLGSLWQLFSRPQADGFYRPLTFVSLWLDYRLFGTAYTWYHAQSLALHIVNSLLAARLAGSLGFGRTASLWTGLLYAAAAVNFEPVMWPAARFDLLATMFTLMALIFGIKYFRGQTAWSWSLALALLSYVLGIMNKESSYCFPILFFFVMCTHKLWSIPVPAKRKLVIFLSCVTVVTFLMITVRFAVYGNLGGYPTAAAVDSAHFVIRLKTITTLLRAVPITIFGVNTSPASPPWLKAVLVAFSALILVAAIAYRGRFGRREYALVACILLASIPVLNIIGWIGESMLHSRYLYLPAVFAMLLIVSTIGNTRLATALLGMYLVLNAMGAASNTWVYRDMLARTGKIADTVRTDWSRHPNVHTIRLIDLPDNPGGVFLFSYELVERIEKRIPDVTVLRQDSHDPTKPATSEVLTYRWDDRDLWLHLAP